MRQTSFCSEKEERLDYRAVVIAEESYRKALDDPGPEEQLGDYSPPQCSHRCQRFRHYTHRPHELGKSPHRISAPPSAVVAADDKAIVRSQSQAL
jgi:hypothetical protein